MKHELPVVTIIGRQNVGKSTLFNTIIREKRAIVDAVPGLTRDVIAFTVSYGDAAFMLNDTPGLDIRDTSQLSRSILDNTMAHLKRSSALILLMENPAPDSYDLELIEITRRLSIPAIIAVNKMDNNECMENMPNFYELGYPDIIPVSALGRFNIRLLLDRVLELLPPGRGSVPVPDLKLAIVGRPNSGKSTLLNSIIGFERSVVSDIPGTTRDSIDEHFMFQRKMIQLIDTAGIRRKSNIRENIEYYSLTRTIESIRQSDVVIHLIDALQGLTETDKKISDEILKAKKPIILAINKWDAVEKDSKTFDEYRDLLQFKFYRSGDFPLISISAKEKTRIHRLMETALDLQARATTSIDTPRLNRFLEGLHKSRKLPQIGERIKVLYATQVGKNPPEFLFFVNNKELFRRDVARYFEKALQQEFHLLGVPITIRFEDRKKKKRG
ncbi:MAG: ribosome biogenesis GTPase Der [Spirochaetes bacterium]|nr:ribosome biogenesis GTPase Der [Spirochaetota bacterium]